MQLSPSAHLDRFCRDSLPPPDQWPDLVFALPELAYPDRLNCGRALLDDVIARYGADRPCVISADDGTAWTYGELRAHADAVAHVLVTELGLVPGNRVLLRGPNNPWLVACWFGVLRAGGVVVATMALLRPGELTAVREIARVDLALCDARFLADLESVEPAMRIVAYGGESGDDLVARCARAGTVTTVDTAADDVALLAFTSGTTGRPKATMHFHRDVLAICDTFARHVLRPRPDDVFVGSPPLAFTFGLGGLVVFPLWAGAATLLLERPSPDALAAAIAAHAATVLFTAPTVYRALLAAGHADRLTSLRRCVSAGEALPRPVWEAFRAATGIRVIDGIGATEMLHIFIGCADDDIRPGSTGRPVPGYEAVVLDDDGEPVPDGVAGRLAVRGPTGCRYLADERQKTYVRGGWNLTGDTYVRDADGYFWYQARSDDMIISAGYNIAGPEVEEALLRHPDVQECGVVGQPDAERGTVVVAHVVLRGGAPGDPEAAREKARELQEFTKRLIAPYKYPRLVLFRDALPRTATGKLQRFRLRQGG